MKRLKMIIVLTLLLSLFLPSQLLGKGKEQKIKGKAKISLRSAILYGREQKDEKAISSYMKVLEEYPDHVFSLYNIAVIYNNQAFEIQMKAKEKQSEILKEAEDKSEDLQKEAEDKAEILKKNAEIESFPLYSIATEYYQKALASINNIPDYKDYDEFETYRNECIKMISNQWQRRFKKSYDLFNEGNNESSIEILNQLVTETPDSVRTYQLLAAIAEKKGDIAKRNEYFQIILQKNPNDTVVLLNLANDYYMEKKFDLAVEYFKKLSELEQEKAEHPLYMGYSLIELKKYDQALEAFDKALTIDPNNLDALGTAASIAQNENKNDKATEYLTRLVSIEESSENLSILCYHLAKLEKWNELIPFAEKWFKNDENRKEPVQILVMAAIRTKNKALETKYTAILKKM